MDLTERDLEDAIIAIHRLHPTVRFNIQPTRMLVNEAVREVCRKLQVTPQELLQMYLDEVR
jgi:hypothetical protein